MVNSFVKATMNNIVVSSKFVIHDNCVGKTLFSQQLCDSLWIDTKKSTGGIWRGKVLG